MKVKTGLRAGVTPQEALQRIGGAANQTAQSLGDAVRSVDQATQNASQSVKGLWNRSGIGDVLNKAFWFPLEPPR